MGMTDPRLIVADGLHQKYCQKHQRMHQFDPTKPNRLWRTHKRFHGDEGACMEVLKMFAPEAFPADMPIEMIDSGLHLESDKDGWCFLEEGIPCVGVLGHPFDEHKDYNPTNPEAFALINCTLKGARFLGVEHNPGLVPILTYSLRSDRSSYRGPWDIDPIMKAWWRMGLQLDDVSSMYHHIFTSWYHVFSGQRTGPQPKRTFRNAIARWMAARFNSEPGEIAVRAGVEQMLIKCGLRDSEDFSEFIDLDKRKGGKTWFDLEGVWDALWAARVPEDVIEHIIWASLDAKYEAGRQFERARAEFREKARYVQAKEHGYSVAVIESDSDYINRAARKEDPNADVLIMTLSSGHHRTFNLHKRLNLDPCAARWREAEILRANGRHSLDWKYLERKGTIPECPKVYASHDELGNFNSTETSPGTPRSGLTTKEVVEIYQNGLAHIWNQYHVEPVRSHNARVAHSKERARQKKAARTAQPPNVTEEGLAALRRVQEELK